MSQNVTPGTVVRYQPDPSRHTPRWCREGTAIADKDGRLVDTYWGSGNDNHVLNDVEVATIETLFHLDDFERLDGHGHTLTAKWEAYHPDDRRRVTSQHGLQARYYLRKGAVPDLDTRIANAQEKVAEAEENLRSAQWRLDAARRDLAELSTPAPV